MKTLGVLRLKELLVFSILFFVILSLVNLSCELWLFLLLVAAIRETLNASVCSLPLHPQLMFHLLFLSQISTLVRCIVYKQVEVCWSWKGFRTFYKKRSPLSYRIKYLALKLLFFTHNLYFSWVAAVFWDIEILFFFFNCLFGYTRS